MIYFVALAVTGIAESFRAVSITPTAQAMLAPEDMGIGTSLVNFANSLSGTIAVAVFAVAYNASTSADPTNVALIQNGCKICILDSSSRYSDWTSSGNLHCKNRR